MATIKLMWFHCSLPKLSSASHICVHYLFMFFQYTGRMTMRWGSTRCRIWLSVPTSTMLMSNRKMDVLLLIRLVCVFIVSLLYWFNYVYSNKHYYLVFWLIVGIVSSQWFLVQSVLPSNETSRREPDWRLVWLLSLLVYLLYYVHVNK